MFSDRAVPNEIGDQFSAKAIRAVERSMKARERLNPGTFLDVMYQDVVHDPIKEVRRVYDFIDLEFSPGTEETMKQWLRKNPQGKHGVHDYQLEDFGLDRERLDPHFAEYRQRYGVPTES
jgi:hypothetical protein